MSGKGLVPIISLFDVNPRDTWAAGEAHRAILMEGQGRGFQRATDTARRLYPHRHATQPKDDLPHFEFTERIH